MPLIDLLGPGIAERTPERGRADRIIADLGLALGMRIDPTAKMARQHLGAQADAKEGLTLRQRHRDPVGLAAHEFVFIVGAHWTAEDDRAHMLRESIGQRVAKAWSADVERIATFLQRTTDAARRGIVAVQDDQDRLAGRRHDQRRRCCCRASTPASTSWRGEMRSRNVTSLLAIPGTTRR